MYKVRLLPAATRAFKDADAPLAKKLARCFTQLEADPRQHANIKPLAGALKGYWRYRVGDHRVIYRIEDDPSEVIVTLIAHRREVYR